MCRERSLSSVWGGFEVKPEEVNENKVVSLHQPHKQVGGGVGGWEGGRARAVGHSFNLDKTLRPGQLAEGIAAEKPQVEKCSCGRWQEVKQG